LIFEKFQRWDDARGVYQRALQLDRDNALAKNKFPKGIPPRLQ
jgi:hypothetical protein